MDLFKVVKKGLVNPTGFVYALVITDYEGGITGPIETDVPCTPTDGGTLPDSDQPCASEGPVASASPRP